MFLLPFETPCVSSTKGLWAIFALRYLSAMFYPQWIEKGWPVAYQLRHPSFQVLDISYRDIKEIIHETPIDTHETSL
ncbi:hypothetical protein CEXT_634391 [Caerostris extrusa]|uniref:Uncharacterized protein n=1 Tax=Caerostris extrusa TaxID=172846 RepID=A0AAV4QR47_CAEEX|nr:hypothetical protein CEXT_634391 [Caerostris extrusa]